MRMGETVYEMLNRLIGEAHERGVQIIMWSVPDPEFGHHRLVAYCSRRLGERLRVIQRTWSYDQIVLLYSPEMLEQDVNHMIDRLLTSTYEARHGAPHYTGG
jgi:hypothetical protein